MAEDHKDVGFIFDSKDLERTKYFNMDGGLAIHVDVWVESFDDQRFWLAHFPKTKNFKFFPKSPDKKKGRDNKRSTGCDRLLKLERTGVIKLGRSQIFCLDSDDSHLKAFLPGYTSLKHPRPHVYSTIVYSMENVVLQPALLDRTFETVTGASVDSLKTKPSDMLVKVSQLSHELLLLIAFYEVVLRVPRDRKRYKDRYLSLLDSLAKFDPGFEIKNCKIFTRFSLGLETLRSDVADFIAASGKLADFNAYKQSMSVNGYAPETSYLFAKGHSLYDAVIESFTVKADSFRDEEIQSLKEKFDDHEDRIRCLESQWLNFEHSLKSAYLAALPEVAYFRECRDRISADYR
ncbi:DUF4435 domain-containing protein [Pseudomonas sp. NPDC090755]|uniref:DUF4435 domain-containing protein n=1 Tax=Pseudomonas sp. NPDC090755 TaxID=3364481 RepID=UPI00383A57DF